MKRQEILDLLAAYYLEIGRLNPPKYENYSIGELRKCVILFKLRAI